MSGGHRRGEVLIDLIATLICLAVLAGVLVGVHRLRGLSAADGLRARDLDQAQDLLVRLRRAADVPLPAAWRVERVAHGDGLDLVTVHAPARGGRPGVRLSTVTRSAP